MGNLSKIAAYYGKDETAGRRDGLVTLAVYDTVEKDYGLFRRGIALTDYNYYGKFQVAGAGALDLINKISFADAARVPINRMMPS